MEQVAVMKGAIRIAVQETNGDEPVSYTHLRAHETVLDLVCRLLLEENKSNNNGEVSLLCSI